MMPTDVQPLTYIDFSLLDSPALPGEYKRFFVLGNVNGLMVSNIDPNIPSLYNQVLPTLSQSNLPKNYQDAMYLIGKDASGTTAAIAHDWIRPNSIVVAARGTITLTIPNIDPSKQYELTALLAARGYTNISCTYTS